MSNSSTLPSTACGGSASWYAVPDTIKQLLWLAATHWEDTAQSEHYMQQALTLADGHLDVLVSAYRYFFYKHKPVLALQAAQAVLHQIQQSEALPTDWNQLAPILIQRQQEPVIRLYLNAYVASGLVLARLGDLDTATTITARVSAIDSRREFGAATVFNVLTHPPDNEE